MSCQINLFLRALRWADRCQIKRLIFYMSNSIASYSLCISEKTKDNEHVEIHSDGSITFSPVVSVELQNHEMTDVEQLTRKSPDEVCQLTVSSVKEII